MDVESAHFIELFVMPVESKRLRFAATSEDNHEPVTDAGSSTNRLQVVS